MFQYRNTKTGTVVTTTCKVAGKNWKEIKPAAEKNSEPPKEVKPVKDAKPNKSTKTGKEKKG